MSRRVSRLVILWALGPFCLLPQAVPNSQTRILAGVSGVVVGADDGQPLSRATVTIEAPAGSRSSTLTGVDGTFQFAGLPMGKYSLFARKTGYVALAYGAKHPDQAGTQVVVDGGRAEPIRMVLPRSSVIAGTVLGDDGQPAPSVVVSVVRWTINPNDGERQLAAVEMPDSEAVTSVVANSRGEFRLHGLPPERYLIRALAAEDPTRTTFATTYYPGTLDAAEAASIVLGTGDEQNLSFSLRRPVRSSISGKILNSGLAFDELQVRIGPGDFPDTARLGPDGTFGFGQVTTGSHHIRARAVARTGNARQVFWGEADVVVSGPEAARVLVGMSPAMAFSGKVSRRVAGQSQTSGTVRISLAPTSSSQRDQNLTTTTAADGSFRIDGVVPGRYRAIVETDEAGSGTVSADVRAILVRGEDVSDRAFTIAPGEGVSDVDIQLTTARQNIVGTVRLGESQRATDVTVIVFSAERRNWTPLSRRTRIVRPATDGSFTIDALPVGDYRIIATEDADVDNVVVPAYLESLVAKSIPLSLGSGEQKTLVLAAER